MLMAKILLIRHGLTTDNINHIFTGWRNTDLAPRGIAEAQAIGEKLKDVPITKAYASDLARSVHTAKLVLDGYHPWVKIIVDPRLRERDYGDIAGKNKDELTRDFPKEFPLWHRSYDVPPPGGESIKDVAKRVIPFLQDVMKDAKPDDIILLSAHGNSLRPIRQYFEHLTDEQTASFEHTIGRIYEYTF